MRRKYLLAFPRGLLVDGDLWTMVDHCEMSKTNVQGANNALNLLCTAWLE